MTKDMKLEKEDTTIDNTILETEETTGKQALVTTTEIKIQDSRKTTNNDTIAAISTPYGVAGIGVIRISGNDCFRKVRKIFFFKKEINEPETHKLYYTKIIDPENNEIIDEALVVYMKAPYTYTREDIIEIQCHSSFIILNRILDLLQRNGIRLAKPGEFTLRAYLNGRIDLTQAESIIDLINAQTEYENKIAINLLQGQLKENIYEIRKILINILATIEAYIDFPEDVENINLNQIIDNLNQVYNKLSELVRDYNEKRILRDGANIAIIGRPNVGKSSLFNALLGTSRVIVSPIPGTTRDIIRESINLNGFRITLIDTAGIRDSSNDPIEEEGIKLTKEELNKSDLILFVIDATNPLNNDDLILLNTIKDKKILLVLNKIDLLDNNQEQFLESILNKIINYNNNIVGISKLSAKTFYGLPQLKEMISRFLIGNISNKENLNFIVNSRQKRLIELALNSCQNAILGIKENSFIELPCIDIKRTINYLDEITGDSITEEILDEIFSNFCIGK